MMRQSLPPLAPKRANPPPNSLKWLATSNYVGRSARKPKSMHVSKERLPPRRNVKRSIFSDIPPGALFRTPYRKRIGIGSPAGMAPGLTTSAGLSHSIVSVDDAGRRPVRRLELIMQPLRRL
jgi:hypothetical protein